MTKYQSLENICGKLGLKIDSKLYTVAMKVYDELMWTCTRCGYSWPKKIGAIPGTCADPKCKSPYWNKQKTRS